MVFSISSFIDPAGNTNSKTDFSIDDNGSRKVAIDVTAPQLISGSVVFSTSNTINDDEDDSSRLLVKNDETIYLDFETNERIDIPSVTINGIALNSTSDVDNDNFRNATPSGERVHTEWFING